MKLDEEVGMVIMRCTTGSMGVLPGHEFQIEVSEASLMEKDMEDD